MMKPESPFADKRVRQALNLAVDKETMIERILLGEGQPMAGMFTSYSLGNDPTIKAYPYDPQKAKELLAQAGYDKGLSVKLTFYPTPTSPMQAQLMEATATYLDKIGVKASIAPMEAGGFLTMWRGRKHTGLAAIASGWGVDGGASTGTWLYSESPYAFFKFPRVDELFVKQKSEMDSAKRLAYLQEINRISYDEAPYIFLVWGNTIWGASARVVDWKLTPGGSYTPNFNLVRLKD